MSGGHASLIGKWLGNWEVLRLIGEGSFGAVYEARNVLAASRRAAIKVLHPDISFDTEIKHRFVNEANAASQANHENIVQVFDVGSTESGVCYIVMELLRGATLAQVLDQGRLEIGRAVNIGVQVARALQAAHGAGVIHRDLKPANLFVVKNEEKPDFVKVLDFGMARLINSPKVTRTGTCLGTPAYMAPEQWQTLPNVDGRCDIYALGVILYIALTGKRPFDANTNFGWRQAHLNEPVPEEPLAALPPELKKLVLRMLAKSRTERPQTMQEVVQALQAVPIPKATPPAAPEPTDNPPDASIQFIEVEPEPSGGGSRVSTPPALADEPTALKPDNTPVGAAQITPSPAPIAMPAPARRRRRIIPVLVAGIGTIVLTAGVVGFREWRNHQQRMADAARRAQIAQARDRLMSALQNRRWGEAIDAAGEVRRIDPGGESVEDRIARAKREQTAKDAYKRYEEARAAGNWENALSTAGEIPSDSVYRPLIDSTRDQVLAKALEPRLEKLLGLKKSVRKCPDAAREAEAILKIDPANAEALAAKQRRCVKPPPPLPEPEKLLREAQRALDRYKPPRDRRIIPGTDLDPGRGTLKAAIAKAQQLNKLAGPAGDPRAWLIIGKANCRLKQWSPAMSTLSRIPAAERGKLKELCITNGAR